MNSPLTGPRLKVERANGQIREIAGLIENLGEGFYEIFPEDDLTNRKKLLKVRCTKELPPMIGVVIGECLFNLRSALDQIYYSAIVRENVEILDRPGFFIEDTEKKFESRLHKRKINQRLPLLATTLRELKPYKGGNELLWKIHWLNSLDKHRILVPMGSMNQAVGYNLAVKAQVGTEFRALNKPVRLDKNDGVIVIYSDTVELKGEMQVAITVGIGDIEGGEIEPVIPTLQQCCDMVSGVIGVFEKRFFSSGN